MAKKTKKTTKKAAKRVASAILPTSDGLELEASSFVAWAIDQRHRKDMVGKLGGLFAKDGRVRQCYLNATYGQLVEHLISSMASLKMRDALKSGYKEWSNLYGWYA